VARALDRMAGGIERMITMLMNDLVTRGHEVDLLTWDLEGAQAFYPMASGIRWQRLDLGDPKVRASKSLMLRRAQAIRALVGRRKPQVIVCFQDGPFMAIRTYTLGLHVPVLAAERNAPNRFNYISDARYRGLIYQSLRFATRITIQCESYRELYPSFLQGRIVCIPNPVPPAATRAQPDVPGPEGRYRLLSVGRLSFQKNYEVLIKAFAHLASKCPSWDLAIVGDGDERASLEALIGTHGLKSRVTLPGTVRSIGQWYASSHLFCLPSRWEGFPNSLAEALAHGLPGVGFAECAGVRDLIAHGRTGLLARGNGELDSLTATLDKAMSDRDLRQSMGNEAVLSVQKFHPTTIFSQWEQLLREVGYR
jgi:GalNAc-alpha-(1->4)-GalNAc-alpha-(1->3)-diNAcBac-PP-undecaprenol alpha-1,4-N-acetyl-D-galactosaminyltransferase